MTTILALPSTHRLMACLSERTNGWSNTFRCTWWHDKMIGMNGCPLHPLYTINGQMPLLSWVPMKFCWDMHQPPLKLSPQKPIMQWPKTGKQSSKNTELQQSKHSTKQHNQGPSTIQSWWASMAWSQAPYPSLPNCKTCPQTSWSLQDYQTNISGCLQTWAAPSMDDSPGISCILTNTIPWDHGAWCKLSVATPRDDWWPRRIWSRESH